MMSKIGRIEASLRTDTGRVRDHNEDFVTYWEPTNDDGEARNGWLYLVADGVGGADAGEVASQFTSERTIKHYLASGDEPDIGKRLLDAMQGANTDLRQLVAERNNNTRMATTMVTAVIRDHQAYIANVGDSRGYHWRNGELRQITKDQSLVAKLLEEGAITEAEARDHPRKNVILYSLGSEREPKIDLFEVPLESDDILILCSDGLTRHVSDEEISSVIAHRKPDIATQSLIEMANSRGGEDNISVAIIRYHSPTETGVPTTSTAVVATGSSSSEKRSLWLYTIILSFVQTILIVIAWLLLHV